MVLSDTSSESSASDRSPRYAESSNSTSSSLCSCCVEKQVNHIRDHIFDDLPMLGDNIYRLNITKNTRRDPITCPICQDRIYRHSPIHKTECDHTFHAHCIILNCTRHTDCPVCRREIFQPEYKTINCVLSHLEKIDRLVKGSSPR